MQCTAAPPALSEPVRRGLPKGVERLLLELLEKRPDDRPGSAADVLYELEPFAPAGAGVRPARAARPGATVTAASEREPSELLPPVAKKAEKQAAPAKKERADTIALVEKAAAPREIAAKTGILIVVLLSLIAGIVTYVARVSGGSDDGRDKPAVTAEQESERRP